MSIFREFTEALDWFRDETHNVGFCTNHGGRESLMLALPGHQSRAAEARAELERLFTEAFNGQYHETVIPPGVLGPSYDQAISEWNDDNVPERDGDGHDGKDYLRG